ncbi:MAG: ribonuclease R [Flavobacteriales bacterium]
MSKPYPRKPRRDRSSSKGYQNTILAVFNKSSEKTLSYTHVCQLIQANKPHERQRVFDALTALAQQGRIKQESHYDFRAIQSEKIIGQIQINQRGNGYVIVPNVKDDIFVKRENLNSARQGDRVAVQLLSRPNQKPEGLVQEVLERGQTFYTGLIRSKKDYFVVIPDVIGFLGEIIIPKEKTMGAKEGMKVVFKVTLSPKEKSNCFGEVTAVLGKAGTNDAEMISILINHGFEPEFPNEVMREASSLSDSISEETLSKRKDFRSVLTFTIDPVDAKDFDDAISFERLENGDLEIGVHIADVGHYVEMDKALDKEALKRCNSVYLVDRVMPMLPEQLSNVICSLRPKEDKLTFSVVFTMTTSGNIKISWFGKTIIHSNRRYSYEEAQEIIEGLTEDPYGQEIKLLDTIAKNIRKKRLKDGALDIQSQELKFIIGENGVPEHTIVKQSKDAHKLIEEFMLLANKAVAKFLSPDIKAGEKYDVLYRVHDTPDPEKIATLRLFCEKFGFVLPPYNEQSVSNDLNLLIQQIEGSPYSSLIQGMIVRSMAKASYSTENKGHFGLHFDFYTHFTSPIRRYADLVIHRMLEEKLKNSSLRNNPALREVCKRISSYERKAIDAERESNKYFQTIMLLEHLGETFSGIVSGITEHGVFVRLTENQCEGMVSIQSMENDRYYFDADKFVLIGRKTGKTLQLGDEVSVIVDEVSPKKRRVDLVFSAF